MAATVPRPKGFSSRQAERWVLMSAFITLAVYTVRRLVEPESTAAPSTSAARAFLGQGTPPNLAQWLIAWATSVMGLAILAAVAPELAGGLAALMVLVTFLESGNQLATDLTTLEHGAGLSGVPIIGSSNAATPTTFDYTGPATGLSYTSIPSNILEPAAAPTPQSVGAAAAAASPQGQISVLNQKIIDQIKALPSPEGYTTQLVTRGGVQVVEVLHDGKVIEIG